MNVNVYYRAVAVIQSNVASMNSISQKKEEVTFRMNQNKNKECIWQWLDS